MANEWFTTTPWLPDIILRLDLLHAFFWYVSSYFACSLILRFRLYRNVYWVARHVQDSCPHLFELLSEHWWLVLQNGMIAMVGVYGLIMAIYLTLNHFVWPQAHISLAELQQYDPSHVAGCLILIGIMLTIDLVLLCRNAVFDAKQVVEDLNFAESWLGGHMNRWLDLLGTYNPIRLYARHQARENVQWFNQMFRTNLSAMTAQLVVRIAVAFTLFANSSEAQSVLLDPTKALSMALR